MVIFPKVYRLFNDLFFKIINDFITYNSRGLMSIEFKYKQTNCTITQTLL